MLFRSCTLFYRRRVEDMPLVEIPEDADERRVEKARGARAKLLEKAMEKYRFRVEPLAAPDGLLLEGDDRYPIMGPGDEIALRFDATALPALPEGWTRDFLIYTQGWIKDADLNTAEGYRVLYAIADVPFFVDLDGVIDHEARRRGETLYLPDRRIPLHPEVLSEGVASLLPEQTAPAFVWELTLDERGEVVGGVVTMR